MKNLLLTLRSALLLFLLLGTVPNALAAYYNRPNYLIHNGIRYNITSDGTVAVAYNYSYNNGLGDIVIPSTVTSTVNNYGEDYNLSFVVTAVEPDAFKNCIRLTSIELPPTVKSIGAGAFNGCTGLTSVTLSSGLESIGREVFGECTSLQSIAIPNSVTSMDWNVFYGCTALTDVTLSNHLRELNGTFNWCSSLKSIKIPTSVVSLNGTFANCTSLNTVAIPNSVAQIGDQTFMGCSGLVSVYIPNSVTMIGNQAFSNTSLTVVEIPNTVTQIGTNAFEGCSQLTSVTSRAVNPPTLSNQNTFTAWIYNNAKLTVPLIAENTYKARNWWNLFQDITGSEKLDNAYDFVVNGIYYNKVDEGHVEVTYKDNNYNSYNGSVSVPASVTHEGKSYSVTGIGNNAFSYCASLTSVTLPATITSIGSNAFTNSGLTSISLHDAVTTIATRAFYGCSKISNLTIPQNITSIGKEAFANCTGLTQLTWNAKHCWSNGDITTTNLNRLTIGSTVEVLPIGFVAQSKITTVNIPASVTFIGSNAFNGCTSLTGITIPKSVTNIGTNAFANCTGLTALTWNARDCNSNGNMYANNITQVTIGSEVETLPLGFVAQSKITTIIIPGSVKAIGSMAFKECGQLANLTMPKTTKTIGEFAFYGCNALTVLTIPRDVISIGYDAFNRCNGLTTLNWNAINCTTNGDMTTDNLSQVTIGNEVTKLPIALAAQSRITSITIPNSVDSICGSAFQQCMGLTSVDIPSSVTYIGGSAFDYCTGLTSVTIGESVNSIGSYAFSGCTGLTSVTIGESVNSIGSCAFYGCTSLTTVISLPLTPPNIDPYCFYNVPSSMIVYVLPEALNTYRSTYYWKDFTIEPVKLNVSNLTVNLPDGVDVAKYADMRLTIEQKGNDQSLYYIIGNQRSYKFANLDTATVWNITLANQYGDIFGKIDNVTIGKDDVSVSFGSLKQPQTVSLTVKTPSGQDVTGQASISWQDENGERLTQGKQIDRLPPGKNLTYSVKLPQELATAYALPADMAYTVKDDNNDIVCQLTAIAQAHLSGKVKDAATNQPLYCATISATQTFAGGNTKTLTVRTDNQGRYTLDALSVPTTLTVAAQGYISQTINCDELMTGSNVTLPDVALSPITGAVVNIILTYTPAHAEGEAAEPQNWYNDYNNVDYTVYNKTAGHAITDVSVQYPQIVLMEDVNDGDVLELTATSRKDVFKPVKTTVTIANQKAAATFNIKELGKVQATFNKNINPKVVGSLYDADDKLAKSADYSGSTLTMDELPDGNYKLVTMGKSDFFNSIYDLDQFASAGLTEGDNYVKNDVQVNSGIISKVAIPEVPFFDESKFYYTGEGTSFTVNKPNIVVGNYQTFRAHIDFKNQYANKVSDVQLIVDLPEFCPLYENSVMIGMNAGAYMVQGNRITIPIANYNDVVRFCAIPTVAGDFAPSAFVKFKFNGKTITQPIGKANFIAKGLSIEVPSITSNNEVTIYGSAFNSSFIEIYDNDVKVGQTVALANGNWLYKYEIPDTSFNCSYHKIYAKVFKGDLLLQTDVKMLEYHSSAVYARSVDMIFGPYNYNFNFVNPSIEEYRYTYPICGSDFTFIVNFSVNDSNAVSNVKVNVLLMDQSIETLDAVYDSSKCKWIAHGKFSSPSRLPINCNVEFEGAPMPPFDDSNRREHEEQNIQISMQELEDYADNLDIVLKDDFEDYVSYIVNSPLTNSQWIVSAKVIDRNTVNLEDGFVFIPEDSYYYKDSYNEDNHFTSTIVDNDSAFVLELYRLETTENHMSSRAPQWWNTFTHVVDVVSDFVLPYKSYVKGVIDFNFWVNYRYPWYINAISEENEWTYQALDAVCDDGSSRLDIGQKNDFLLIIQDYQKMENDFYSSVDALANLWSVTLRNAFYFEALTSCLGKAIKALPQAQFYKSNGKGGGLIRYVVTGGLEKRNRVENIINYGFNPLINGIKIIGDWAEFMDYGSVSEQFQAYLNTGYTNFINLYSGLRSDIRSSYKKCKEKKDPKDDFPHPPLKPYIDPSGFVYEGVPSNRLQGVTATCYYKETVEDMYGDEHENVVLWDAEQYGQKNPLLTDENGFYRWDVSIGMWQVKYEKEGYETTYSDWLPVPPPQLDVNIGMVQMRQPEVIKARAYPKAVEFEFDKFMFPEDLTTQNIKVTDKWGDDVSGSIELLNAEVDDPLAITSIRRAPGTGLTFASKVRFNSRYWFSGNEVTLHVSKRVKSYANLEMAEDYVVTLPIEYEMEKIVADSSVNILYGDSRKLTVTVQPTNVSKGKTLTVRSVGPMIATTDAESYTINRNGQAVITVHGDLPGMTSLIYSIDGYDLSAATLVNVMMESQMTVATPTATVASGSEVVKGTAIYLRCSTPGATIYYTLDGSCPCDNTPARKVYDGSPIIIDHTMTIKAMATAPELYDSDVATFVYRVGSGVKGDVNGDGEVNIADINALIDIILSDDTDADTLARADVNEDGEINVADINALIDIILTPIHLMSHKVNCDDRIHLDNVTMKPSEVRTLQITVDNASHYSAMQCDIVLPEGLTLMGTSATGNNVSKIGDLDELSSRALTYSMSKSPFKDNGQGILSLTVRADAALSLESEITLTNVILADQENRAWHIDDCTARVNNSSGINDLTAITDRVWVEGHTLFIETRHEGTAQLASINGIVRDITLKHGINQLELEQGIYIVVINGCSHKIAIK